MTFVLLSCPYCGAEVDCVCCITWGESKAQVQCGCGYRSRIVGTMERAVQEHNRLAGMAGQTTSMPDTEGT